VLGEDEKKMRFVYSRTRLVKKLLKELEIGYEKRSFGVIPVNAQRGGLVIVKRLQKNIREIAANTMAEYFQKTEDGFIVHLRDLDTMSEYLLKTKNLILASGGYGGRFEHTSNVRYKNYGMFDAAKKNGARIINTQCVFLHPFGYDNGRKLLIGKEAKNGEFIDEKGERVFSGYLRYMIKHDDYHEKFGELLFQADRHRKKGHTIYFADDKRQIEITPSVHYTSGGVKTDHMAKAIGCQNLFAIGECQANGSRNNGRFPGYPFTSAIVYAKTLAERL